jgi:hypothetical protein
MLNLRNEPRGPAAGRCLRQGYGAAAFFRDDVELLSGSDVSETVSFFVEGEGGSCVPD